PRMLLRGGGRVSLPPDELPHQAFERLDPSRQALDLAPQRVRLRRLLGTQGGTPDPQDGDQQNNGVPTHVEPTFALRKRPIGGARLPGCRKALEAQRVGGARTRCWLGPSRLMVSVWRARPVGQTRSGPAPTCARGRGVWSWNVLQATQVVSARMRGHCSVCCACTSEVE